MDPRRAPTVSKAGQSARQDEGRLGRLVRNEEIRDERLRRVDAIAVATCLALSRKKRLVDEDISRKALCSFLKDQVSRVGHDVGRAGPRDCSLSAKEVPNRGV